MSCCHSLPLTLAVLPQLHGRPLPVSSLSDVLIPGSRRPSCLPPATLWTCFVSEPCVQMESFCPLTPLAVDEAPMPELLNEPWFKKKNKWDESPVCMCIKWVLHVYNMFITTCLIATALTEQWAIYTPALYLLRWTSQAKGLQAHCSLSTCGRGRIPPPSLVIWFSAGRGVSLGTAGRSEREQLPCWEVGDMQPVARSSSSSISPRMLPLVQLLQHLIRRRQWLVPFLSRVAFSLFFCRITAGSVISKTAIGSD